MPMLKDKIVLITRSREQSSSEITMLENAGAEVVPFPTIKATAVSDTSAIDKEIKKLNEFDYVIFSSKNAVKFFHERLNTLNETFPENIMVVCVGSKTSKYAQTRGINVNVVPEEFSAAGIIKALSKYRLPNKKILIPSSVIARDELSEGLEKSGADVHAVPVYDIVAPESKDISEQLTLISESKPDAFIFTSPSSFRNYLSLLSINNPKQYFENKIITAIGSTTADEIIKHDVHVDIVPEEFTVKACVAELIDYYKTVHTV